MSKLKFFPMRAVKESFDLLPAGLLYCWEGGLIKLANSKMEDICKALTGESLKNGKEFWQMLYYGENEYVQGGNDPIAVLPDKKTYSFKKNRINFDGSVLYEIIAVDISSEYELNRLIRRRQEHARYVNARLKALERTVELVAAEKEALKAKIKIHDSLGHSLLMTKRHLFNPNETEIEDIIDEWKKNIAFLKHEEEHIHEDPYFFSGEQALALGVELVVRGEFPKDDRLSDVINDAITVHVTNVFRHAQGDKAILSITENEKGYTIVFTNNGKLPKIEIEESGGLKNLRTEVENIGGAMSIKCTPEFELVLQLPKESKYEL